VVACQAASVGKWWKYVKPFCHILSFENSVERQPRNNESVKEGLEESEDTSGMCDLWNDWIGMDWNG